MPETIRATFQFALGQLVEHAGDPVPWRVHARLWEERADLGPVVWYRLTRPCAALGVSAYEADLLPWAEEEPC